MSGVWRSLITLPQNTYAELVPAKKNSTVAAELNNSEKFETVTAYVNIF